MKDFFKLIFGVTFFIFLIVVLGASLGFLASIVEASVKFWSGIL